jgi:pimeloyl-ACP methyl ester carboxylesterase
MQLALRKAVSNNRPNGSILPDIIFLHGTGSNSKMWDAQVEFFSQHSYRCFLVDWRGHGATPEPFESTDLRRHITDLVETISTSDIRFPAYFVGHSLGAIASVTLAQRQPKLFAGIFALSLPAKVLSPTVQCFRVFINGPMQIMKMSGLHRLLAWRERTLIEMNPFTLKEIADNFATVDFLSQRITLRCPIYFANGRFDLVAPLWWTQKLQKMLPGSTLRIFEWAGHNFMDVRPDEVNRWILEKISTVTP